MIEPERILLLSRLTANRMFIPAHMKEDAIGEAALAGVKAAASYSADRGANIETHIINSMRWAIRDYVQHEFDRPVSYFPEGELSIIDPRNELDAKAAWEDVVAAIRSMPDTLIQAVLVGYAGGRHISEISRRCRMTGWEVAAYREIGITQLRELVII